MKSLLCFIFLWSPFVLAYPELIRHGYTQCTACHVSPNGGGLLNAYGRELSTEILSTWSYKNEAQFLHSSVGAKLAEKGYLFGGGLRAIQTRYQDKNMLDGKLFLMHADLQVAYVTERFTGVISIGEIEQPGRRVFKGNFKSTMYYGYLRVTDEFGLRAGRFIPSFGINSPDHLLVTRDGIGFGINAQFDTLEASYLSENWTIFASASRTMPDVLETSDEQYAKTFSVNYNFLNRMRVGMNYMKNDGPATDRTVWGPHAILGFTEHLFSITEVFFRNDKPSSGATDGVYAVSQLGYEIYKGLVPYIQYQHKQTKLTDSGSIEKIYNAGVKFYPRPHWEFHLEYGKIKGAKSTADMGWLMTYYYF